MQDALEPSLPQQLFHLLKTLDPEVLEAQYKSSGAWDLEALQYDIAVTTDYTADSLDKALAPVKEELLQHPKECVADTIVEIIPDVLYLGGRSNLDVDCLRSRGIRSVINCAPQSVASGMNHYGDLLA
eukprot:4782445-Amphidinium_carterae.1